MCGVLGSGLGSCTCQQALYHTEPPATPANVLSSQVLAFWAMNSCLFFLFLLCLSSSSFYTLLKLWKAFLACRPCKHSCGLQSALSLNLLRRTSSLSEIPGHGGPHTSISLPLPMMSQQLASFSTSSPGSAMPLFKV